MTRSYKPLMMGLALASLSFLIADDNQLSAYHYSQEHAAWGGNGGWWGGGNDVFYDDYPWRTEDSRACQTCRQYHPCPHCGNRNPRNGRYAYRDYTPPQNEYEYNDTVPGAGLYINLEPNH